MVRQRCVNPYYHRIHFQPLELFKVINLKYFEFFFSLLLICNLKFNHPGCTWLFIIGSNTCGSNFITIFPGFRSIEIVHFYSRPY